MLGGGVGRPAASMCEPGRVGMCGETSLQKDTRRRRRAFAGSTDRTVRMKRQVEVVECRVRVPSLVRVASRARLSVISPVRGRAGGNAPPDDRHLTFVLPHL